MLARRFFEPRVVCGVRPCVLHSQREGDRNEKRQRADKEREDRKARQQSGTTDSLDDQIDYIDVEGRGDLM